MSLRIKNFEKMVRGDVERHDKPEEETINEIKFCELKYLKQQIIVNSLSHISDDVLLQKCADISAHYRLFKDDESCYIVQELFDDEKNVLKRSMSECIEKECARILKEKESIPTGMLIFIVLNLTEKLYM